MIKKTIAIYLFVLTNVASALSLPKDSTLYVNASSGLNMRMTPGTGHVIGKLDFGDRVQVIEDRENLGYDEKIEWVTGRWIKVKAKNVEGFVFSGFLTKIPNYLIFSTLDHNVSVQENFIDFFEKNFVFDAANCEENGSIYIETSETISKDIIVTKIESSSFSTVQIDLEDVSVMEIYHFLISMAKKSERQNLLDNSNFRANAEGKIDNISVKNENITLSKSGKGVSVKFSQEI